MLYSEETYNIGLEDGNRVLIRVLNSSGAGHWSREWITYDDIRAKISDATDGKSIASFQLLPLFKAKGVNTPSFLLALLLNEKLQRPLPDKKRVYACTGDKTFLAKVDKLRSAKEAI